MWSAWREGRERRQRAERYLRAALTAPSRDDVAWLSALAPTDEVSRRELTFIGRAVARIVAERDALDDRTGAEVAHALQGHGSLTAYSEAWREGWTTAWEARWREYREALAVRGGVVQPAERMAAVMFTGAGIQDASPADRERAVGLIQRERARANDALREAFGAVSMPDDVRPSAIRG